MRIQLHLNSAPVSFFSKTFPSETCNLIIVIIKQTHLVVTLLVVGCLHNLKILSFALLYKF